RAYNVGMNTLRSALALVVCAALAAPSAAQAQTISAAIHAPSSGAGVVVVAAPAVGAEALPMAAAAMQDGDGIVVSAALSAGGGVVSAAAADQQMFSFAAAVKDGEQPGATASDGTEKDVANQERTWSGAADAGDAKLVAPRILPGDLPQINKPG